MKKTSTNPLADCKPSDRLGIYLGESSRSLHERMAEHVEDARKFRVGSHIVKHWMEEHPKMTTMPPWSFKTLRSFKDCLTRQLTEAVAISLSSDSLLNGKCDYLANCISRVTVDEDEYDKKKREIKEELDEKERLLKLEEFKKEKSGKMAGVKRKISPTQCITRMKTKAQKTKPNVCSLPLVTFQYMMNIEMIQKGNL